MREEQKGEDFKYWRGGSNHSVISYHVTEGIEASIGNFEDLNTSSSNSSQVHFLNSFMEAWSADRDGDASVVQSLLSLWFGGSLKENLGVWFAQGPAQVVRSHLLLACWSVGWVGCTDPQGIWSCFEESWKRCFPVFVFLIDSERRTRIVDRYSCRSCCTDLAGRSVYTAYLSQR